MWVQKAWNRWTGSLLGQEESLLAKGGRGEQGGLKEAWDVVVPSGKWDQTGWRESRLSASTRGSREGRF